MPKQWRATCKDCGVEFAYSDFVHQNRLKRGLSAPERCVKHRKIHVAETNMVASSHFGLRPAKNFPILGIPFLGKLERSARIKPILEKIDPDKSGMDIGLTSEHVLEIYQALDNSRVLIIVAPTGSGKSTVIPSSLIDPLPSSGLNRDHFTSQGRKIIVTQPRRAAAGSISGTVATKFVGSGVGPGSEIGFRHGKEHSMTDSWNRLEFVTDGSLVNSLTDHRASEFSIVIVDEAHERSARIDLILALMRVELQRYPHLRLIILSATIEANTFVNYFENVLPGQVWERNFEECKKAYGYTLEFRSGKPLDEGKMVEAMASKVLELIVEGGPGGILGFLPGQKEIEKAIDLISKKLSPALLEKTQLEPLYASLEQSKIDKACNSLKPRDRRSKALDYRKVVIATNVAETSLTIPDISFVVDSGLIKEMWWDPTSSTESLHLSWHSQAGCKQRWGRAGRNQPGQVYTLYTKAQYKSFKPHTLSEVERECLDDFLFSAARSGFYSLHNFPWLSQPSSLEIERASQAFKKRGIIAKDGGLSAYGEEVHALYKLLSALSNDKKISSDRLLERASLLLQADKYGCLVEAATAVCVWDRLGSFTFDRERGLFSCDKTWSLAKMDKFCRTFSSLKTGCLDDLDFGLKLVALYEKLKTADGDQLGGEKWTSENYLNIKALDDVISQRQSLLSVFLDKASSLHILRPIDLLLINRLRIICYFAWPDKIFKLKDGIWSSDLLNTQYITSPNSVANLWSSGTQAIVATGSSKKMSANSSKQIEGIFFIAAPIDKRKLESQNDLVMAIRADRICQDVRSLEQRLLTDIKFPIDSLLPDEIVSAFNIDLTEKKIKSKEAEISNSETIRNLVLRWVTSSGNTPDLIMYSAKLPLSKEGLKIGESRKVEVLREILFMPTGEAIGLCTVTRERTLFLNLNDLCNWSGLPATHLIGSKIEVEYMGMENVDGPIFSGLRFLEKDHVAVLDKRYLVGSFAGYQNNNGTDKWLDITIPSRKKSLLFHFASICVKNHDKTFEGLVLGDNIFFPVKENYNKDGLKVRLKNQKFTVKETDLLSKDGFQLSGDYLTVSGKFDCQIMYSASLRITAAEKLIKLLYWRSNKFKVYHKSVQTDESLMLALRFLEDGRSILAREAEVHHETFRDELKALVTELSESLISDITKEEIKYILYTRNKIKNKKYKFYKKQNDYKSNIEKLSEWIQNARKQNNVKRYKQFLKEDKLKLEKLISNRDCLENEWNQDLEKTVCTEKKYLEWKKLVDEISGKSPKLVCIEINKQKDTNLNCELSDTKQKIDNLPRLFYVNKAIRDETFDKAVQNINQKRSWAIYFIFLITSIVLGALVFFDEMEKWLKLAVEKVNILAQNELGRKNAERLDVEQNDREAEKLIRQSEERYSTTEQNELGRKNAERLDVEQNDREAEKLIRQSEERYSTTEQYELGIKYYNGYGVEKNYIKAEKLFRQAAEQNYTPAHYELGRMYYNGHGVVQSYREAIIWWEAAVNGGHSGVAYKIADIYFRGLEGVFQNKHLAIMWYRHAAEMENNADAQYMLGEMYYSGDGVQQNDQEAAKWFKMAADVGHAGAANNLGFIYYLGHSVVQHKRKAAKWFKIAAEQENSDAQYMLGEMYYSGDGVRQDDQEAVKWFQRAADVGHASAANSLGYIYYFGLGVVQDKRKALNLFDQAARQGHTAAQHNIQKLY